MHKWTKCMLIALIFYICKCKDRKEAAIAMKPAVRTTKRRDTPSSIPLFTPEDPHSRKHVGLFKSSGVASENLLCSQVAVKLLAAGGNAVDAAIGATICIGVLNAFSSGIGGGGFMLIAPTRHGTRSPAKTPSTADSAKSPAKSLSEQKNRSPTSTSNDAHASGTPPNQDSLVETFDFREAAPAATRLAPFKQAAHRAKIGGLAVAVPGEIRGLHEAHRAHGRLPWKSLFQHSVILARGFPASPLLVAKLQRNRQAILADPGLRAVYAPTGELLSVGATVRRLNYARTLTAIATDPLSFYEGPLAAQIIQAVRSAGGVLTHDDLRAYRVHRRPALHARVFGFDAYTIGPPGAGAAVLAVLQILARFDMRALRRRAAAGEIYALYHLLVEAHKYVAARRGELGDPAAVPQAAVVRSLLAPASAEAAAARIQQGGPFASDTYGATHRFCEDHGTTHLSVIDGTGMVAQVTSTINLEFGAKFMDPVTGILFNNQMDDFYIPGVANAYGLGEMSANLAGAGRRPFSSAAPLFLAGPREVIALGAAGGTRIPTAVVGTVAYLLMGLGLDSAVAGARVHEQLHPDTVLVESIVPDTVQQQLRALGHRVTVSHENTLFTSVQAVQAFRKCATCRPAQVVAVADPRKNGGVAGY